MGYAGKEVAGKMLSPLMSPPPALRSPSAPEVINYEPLSSATDMW